MVEVRMTMDEYLTLLSGMAMDSPPAAPENEPRLQTKKRSTAYQRKYKTNFRKIAPKFKLKNGNWKKNGFKSAVKEAHKMSKGTTKGQVRKTARRAYEK